MGAPADAKNQCPTAKKCARSDHLECGSPVSLRVRPNRGVHAPMLRAWLQISRAYGARVRDRGPRAGPLHDDGLVNDRLVIKRPRACE